MTAYLVEWTVEVEAEDVEAAAREALAMQRDPSSDATHFRVQYVGDIAWVEVDLGGQEKLREEVEAARNNLWLIEATFPSMRAHMRAEDRLRQAEEALKAAEEQES